MNTGLCKVRVGGGWDKTFACSYLEPKCPQVKAEQQIKWKYIPPNPRGLSPLGSYFITKLILNLNNKLTELLVDEAETHTSTQNSSVLNSWQDFETVSTFQDIGRILIQF